MANIKVTRYAMAAMLVLLATPVFAQAPATPPAGAPAKPPGSEPEPKLAFDREVFSYPAEGRRDPFKPLVGGPNAGGPLFNDIVLRGIIYSPDPRRSVALVQVGGKRTFRLRRGDVIGNARVLDIAPLRVRFAVENFGTVRTETVDLRNNTPAAPTVTPAEPQDQATPPRQTEPGVNQQRRNRLDPGMVRPAPATTNNEDKPLEPEARR